MLEYVAPILAGISCASLLLLPLLLRTRGAESPDRDAAWRDRLPLMLHLLRPAFHWYAASVDSGLTHHERELLQGRLDTAGNGYRLTPAEFIVARRTAVVVGAALACYVAFVLRVADPFYLITVAGLPLLAWFYPDIWLRDAARNRQAAVEREFPFFLDVLVLGMKAGLTFAAAVEQAVEHLRPSPLRDELARYLRETRTGVARRAALDRMAARILLPAVTNFVAAVSQAEQTGGSLGDVLTDQARQRRVERFLRAEKLANQAPVKMLLPLLALLFPITFIIIGFPIVVQLAEAGVLDWL